MRHAVGTVGGTLGCVEILDGGWSLFLDEIESIAGADCVHIGAAHYLTVVLDPDVPRRNTGDLTSLPGASDSHTYVVLSRSGRFDPPLG